MFCSSCGSPLSQGASFCSSCGKSLMDQSSPPSKPILSTSQPLATPRVVEEEPLALTVNGFGWALAAVPAIAFIADLFLAQQVTLSDFTLWSFLISFALNTAFTLLDVNELKRANQYKPGNAFWGVILVPVYLFLRSRSLKTHQGMFTLWMVLFFFSLIIRF